MREAEVKYIGRETREVPFGAIDTHHLRIIHESDGGTTTSDFWFAADPSMQRVMVSYRGPYGVTYDLKHFGRWAYWDKNDVRPDLR